MHITTHGSVNFIITSEMFFFDEDMTQSPLKYIERLDLALPKIPTKELYKLQVRVMKEIQYRARSDAMNLQLM
jgi:hypothetical protein